MLLRSQVGEMASGFHRRLPHEAALSGARFPKASGTRSKAVLNIQESLAHGAYQRQAR